MFSEYQKVSFRKQCEMEVQFEGQNLKISLLLRLSTYELTNKYSLCDLYNPSYNLLIKEFSSKTKNNVFVVYWWLEMRRFARENSFREHLIFELHSIVVNNLCINISKHLRTTFRCTNVKTNLSINNPSGIS